MAYEMQVDKERGNVKISYFCPTTTEEIRRGRKEMIEKCEENNIHKILLDLYHTDTASDLSITDCYFLADSWTQEETPPRFFLACVMPKDQETRKRVSFYITAAKNRGVFIEGFDDVDSAGKWLATK